MSEYYTDDDVTAGAQGFYEYCTDGDRADDDWSDEDAVRAVLAAVAPAIAARALREAADAWEDRRLRAGLTAGLMGGWLRARAQQVSE